MLKHIVKRSQTVSSLCLCFARCNACCKKIAEDGGKKWKWTQKEPSSKSWWCWWCWWCLTILMGFAIARYYVNFFLSSAHWIVTFSWTNKVLFIGIEKQLKINWMYWHYSIHSILISDVLSREEKKVHHIATQQWIFNGVRLFNDLYV